MMKLDVIVDPTPSINLEIVDPTPSINLEFADNPIFIVAIIAIAVAVAVLFVVKKSKG